MATYSLEALLSPGLRTNFEKYHTEDQKNVVSELQAFVIKVRDGTDEQRKDLGVPWGSDTEENTKNTLLTLGASYWQLSQFFRYSKPTRIDEAAPGLRSLTEQYNKEHNGSQGDVTPLLYLGVSLHKAEGKEEEANKAFEDGFRYSLQQPGLSGPNTELWARAAWSRMLRRQGKISEAETQEAEIRLWLQGHPYGMTPSKFRSLVTDGTLQQGQDYIMDHPDMIRMTSGATELPGGVVMHTI